MQLDLRNDLTELSLVAKAVDDFTRDAGATAADLHAFHLALEEIVTNVIQHGYRDGGTHTLRVTLEAPARDLIRATVMDDAPAFNPLARPDVDTALPLEEREAGGLGVHLVRKLMDLCLYERREGRNLFTVERKLHRTAGTPPPISIAASKLEATAVLALSGRLDALSSPDLERQLSALLKGGVRTVEFDLSGLAYVSSAGLRVFLVAAKTLRAAGGRTRFTGLNPSVRKVFEVAGLLTVLDVAPAS